jgi:hypothetical protein
MRSISLVVPEPFEEGVPRSGLALMGKIPLVLLKNQAAVVDQYELPPTASFVSVSRGPKPDM